MADEDWEPPDSFVQILLVGGGVHDVSVMAFELLLGELDSNKLVSVEDVYGSDCNIRPSYITSTRHWNKEAGRRWRLAHPHHDDEYE